MCFECICAGLSNVVRRQLRIVIFCNRNLNNYVGNSFNQWDTRHRISLQSSPCDSKYSGTSSFGMSGVNAHAIIKRVDVSQGERTMPLWQSSLKSHVEVLQTHHPMLYRFNREDEIAEFSSSMNFTALAGLRDHIVNSMPILPAAAYLEMSASASISLLRIAPIQVAIVQASIVSPLIIQQSESFISLSLLMDLRTQGITIRSFMDGVENRHFSAISGRPHNLPGTGKSKSHTFTLDCTRAKCQNPNDSVFVYQEMASAGLQYGPIFRQVLA